MNTNITINPHQVIVNGQTYRAVGSGILNENQWYLLEQAEATLYTPFMGCHAFTDVIPREEGQLAAALWDQAYFAVEATCDATPVKSINVQVAQRVARALALISFGSEFLLK